MTLDERLWKSFNKALGQFQLLADGDNVLVGLSGGKDSLLLLELLARRAHITHPSFRVQALHVRMEDILYESSTDSLKQFCDDLNVPLHIITTSIKNTFYDGATSQLKNKPTCFLCSWQRRKQLFNIAQQLGCNKIALGHHQDDIIHTALMNLTFQGHFSTMPALLRMRKMPLTIIRPLCLCQEADIRTYAEQKDYPKMLKQCPYENDSNRTTIQEVFKHMQELNPEARYSIWHAIESAGKLQEY